MKPSLYWDDLSTAEFAACDCSRPVPALRIGKSDEHLAFPGTPAMRRP
jgi:hypothetical protein